MYIIMLGAPGSGKGTIGSGICDKFNLEHLSTGDIFRSEIKNQTELGKEAEKYISKGQLVPDEITIAMVESKLDNMQNVLFDGFPRTIEQAESLKEYLKNNEKNITAVIELDVPDEDIIKRTSSRVTCPNKSCGATYNTIFLPPKVEGICDKCGTELIKRKDDEPETIKERLQVYHNNTKPLIDFYKKEGLLESVKIDIYSPTTREDTIQASIEKIEERLK